MDVRTINELLSRGEIDHDEMWPHLVEVERQPVKFSFEFGLEELPKESGLITIRGARQYGKSTWLEMNLKESVQQFGAGSVYYLNGDDIASTEDFSEALLELGAAYAKGTKVRRLFIDEVTVIPSWEKGLKKVVDRGLLRDVLVITTGSKAIDLRRGSEKLPGRKGKLARSEYLFLPISYKEFHRACSKRLRKKTWIAYLLSGGSPIACNELYAHGRLPEYFIQLIRDWVLGEIVESGRNRLSLANMMSVFFRFGGQPVGYAKLARESGLANNTVASGYVEQLTDLLSVTPSWPWDHSRNILQLRKPCKFHFINMAAAVVFHPAAPRTVHEFEELSEEEQALLIEWLVAQEVWRISALGGIENPEAIGFWLSKENEIDFVTPEGNFIEVKRGRAGPLDFSWFGKVFPKRTMTVVCSTPFETDKLRGVTVHEFLLGERAR